MKVRARRSPRIPMDGLSPNDRTRLEQFLDGGTRVVVKIRDAHEPTPEPQPRKRGRRS